MSSEVLDYINKAEEKIQTAKVLFDLGRYEDSVSRSYYSVLNTAKAVLASEGLYPRTHEGVLKMFGERIVKEKGLPRSLGAGFSRLKTLREKADYSPKIEITKSDAEWSIKFSEQFLNQIKEYLERIRLNSSSFQ